VILGLCLTGIGQASAQALNQTQQQVVNNLSSTSAAIKGQVALGSSVASRLTTAAQTGVIVDPTAYQAATISEAQRAAYNSSMTVFTNTNYSAASQVFLQKAYTNVASMQQSISQLATASADLQKATSVNQMLQGITDAPTARATQTAINNAGLSTEISGAQVAAYNTSLANVNSYASQAAAFFRAADSVQLTTNVDNFAKQYNKDLAYASAGFSYATGTLSVSFSDGLAIAQSGALNQFMQSASSFYAPSTAYGN
jgi:hypothetical protein